MEYIARLQILVTRASSLIKAATWFITCRPQIGTPMHANNTNHLNHGSFVQFGLPFKQWKGWERTWQNSFW